MSTRTIYRDIETLSVSGIPVMTIPGYQGGIQLMDGYVLDRTLMTQKELTDMTMALRSLKTLPFFSSEKLFSKLSSLFSVTNSTEHWLEISFTHWGDGQLMNEQMYAEIRDSILRRRQMKLTYMGTSGRVTKRMIEPLKLVFQQRDWYLYAFCLMRRDFRFFKLNRMRKLVPTTVACQHDYQQYSALAKIETKPRPTKMLDFRGIFDQAVLHIVYDAVPNVAVEPLAKGKFRVSAKLPDDSWLRSFWLSFGKQVVIEQPCELAEEIKRMHLDAAGD